LLVVIWEHIRDARTYECQTYKSDSHLRVAPSSRKSEDILSLPHNSSWKDT